MLVVICAGLSPPTAFRSTPSSCKVCVCVCVCVCVVVVAVVIVVAVVVVVVTSRRGFGLHISFSLSAFDVEVGYKQSDKDGWMDCGW